MALAAAGAGVLEACEREVPVALPGEVLIRVHACGVCLADVHLLDGALTPAEMPIVPGHEIVGVVEVVGDGVTHLRIGDRVGVAWLGYACGACGYCASARENLCREARFTGVHMDGGYADYAVADADYVFKLPDGYSDLEAAPLLCAGAAGLRAYRMTGNPRRLGLYGAGTAAEVVARLAAHDGLQVFAASPADPPPAPLDAAIVFSEDSGLLIDALSHVAPGGLVVSAGFRVSDVPSFSFRHLRDERAIKSVTNVTRDDVRELLALAASVPIKTRVQRYELADANRAVADVRDGRVEGAAVLTL